jgi:hypothetical protein
VPARARVTANIFGQRNVGTVHGWVLAAHQIDAAPIAFGDGLAHT